MSIFDTEGCSGIGVKVPSTENPEMLVLVNACTDEVSNCRQIAATNTVILKENQNNETSESSGKLAAKGVTIKFLEDVEQEPRPFQKRIWSVVPCSPDLPDDVDSDSSTETAWLTRHAGKRENDGAFSWKRLRQDCQN